MKKIVVILILILLCFIYYTKTHTLNKLIDPEVNFKAKIAAGNKISHYNLGNLYYSRAKDDSDIILLKALNEYNKAVKAGYLDALLSVAEIYQFCSIPKHNIPNKDLAYAIYLRLIRESPSEQIRVAANVRLTQLNQERTQEILKHRAAQAIPFNRPEINLNDFGIELPAQRNIIELPQQPIRNDSQNVHDTTVQKTFNNSIKQLQKAKRYNDYYTPNDKCFEEIRAYITENSPSKPDKRQQALYALDIIKKENQFLMGPNTNESEVLALIWNRIKAPVNHNNTNALKESFVDQLADCMVSGQNHAYCATGRATRLVSSLQKIDAQSDVFEMKPKWAVKEELAMLAGNTRAKVLAAATRAEREAYENPDPQTQNEREFATRMEKKIKSAIETKAKEEYIDTSILTKQELDLELKPMLDAI